MKVALIVLFMSSIRLNSMAQTQSQANQARNQQSLKLNCGFVTAKLSGTKEWYQRVLNFKVVFENDFYVLLSTPNKQAQLSFLLPDHPTQQAPFQPAFQGKGAYITIEIADVDAEYQRLKALNIPIAIDLRNEPWGDRHFAIIDPNGIGIDLVTFKSPPKK